MSFPGQVSMPHTEHFDLTRSKVPVLIMIAALAASIGLAFAAGTAWNSSAQDLNYLKNEVTKLNQRLTDIQAAMNIRDQSQITSKDLTIFCFQLAQINKGFNCPKERL